MGPLASWSWVSFFDYDMFGIVPDFTLRNYLELFGSDLTYALPEHPQVRADRLGYHLVLGFWVAYFLVFHVRTLLCRDRAVPGVHGAVLDLEHHPHDLLDPVARPNGIFNQS